MIRIAGAIILALAVCLAAFALLSWVESGSGLAGIGFLIILPALMSAFVSYVGDPFCERGFGYYVAVPACLMVIVLAVSVFYLQEGVVCIVMLMPIWLMAGIAGSFMSYKIGKRLKKGRLYCAALLLLPFLAIEAEILLPVPMTDQKVVRTITINASAEKIWPLLRDIPNVRKDEGSWNFSQNVIGLPRPQGAYLVGSGKGAQRFAKWERDIKFREIISNWKEGEKISWNFKFDDLNGWQFTDHHLMPGNPYFGVTTGGYSLKKLGADKSQLTLETNYWMRTPLNNYAAFWGEVFLGDIHDNLLILVKERAEN